jgi:hypothetical protein
MALLIKEFLMTNLFHAKYTPINDNTRITIAYKTRAVAK